MVEIDRVLQRWGEALGGIERLAAVRTLEKQGRMVVYGLPGEVRVRASAAGRFSQSRDFEFDGLGRQIVINGEQAWLKDAGKVQSLTGIDRALHVTLAYLESFSALIPGRMPGRVQGAEATAEGDWIELLPEGGLPMRLCLDRESGRPRWGKMELGSVTLRWNFEDWREVDGLWFAFRWIQLDEPEENSVETTFETIRLNTPEVADWFEQPLDDPVPYEFAPGCAAVTVPFELNCNKIYFPARVNGGEPPAVILDTGFGGIAIDADWMATQGWELDGRAAAGGAGAGLVETRFARGVTLELPGVIVRNQPVDVMPLTRILQGAEGRAVGGLWGGQLIRHFVIEVDYGRERLTFYDRAGYEYHGPGQVVPIDVDQNCPHVQATISWPGREPVTGRFLVDVGLRPALSFSVPFLERHGFQAEPGDAPVTVGWGIGGEVQGRLARIGLRMGPWEFPSVVSILPASAAGATGYAGFEGIIGADLMRRFKVILDYSREQIIMEPLTGDWDRPFGYDASGLFLRAQPADYRRIEILSVDPRSAAGAIGLQAGDELLALDGIPVAGFGLEGVRRRLLEVGRTLQLAVRRGTAEWSVVLTTRPRC